MISRWDETRRELYRSTDYRARRYRRFAETLDDGVARSLFPREELSIMQTAALWEIGLTNVYRSRVRENRFNTALTYHGDQLSATQLPHPCETPGLERAP